MIELNIYKWSNSFTIKNGSLSSLRFDFIFAFSKYCRILMSWCIIYYLILWSAGSLEILTSGATNLYRALSIYPAHSFVKAPKVSLKTIPYYAKQQCEIRLFADKAGNGKRWGCNGFHCCKISENGSDALPPQYLNL